MRILFIEDRTDDLHNVEKALAGHEVEVQVYQPGLNFNDQDKDLVVLSGGGGEGFELKDIFRGKLWYADEIDFVLSCEKPILGICMGFEVISAAFGSKVEHMGKLIKGFQPAKLTATGREKVNKGELRQYEWHQYGVKDVLSKHFEVLAYSDTGLEMIKHRRRPIVATQFHPEKGGTVQLASLLQI
jgi:anthranilate/para-aminobenzoate synthase component II